MAWKNVQYQNGKYRTSEGGGGGHTYSTTEQVIATWIDGSDIYERTFVFDTPLSVAYNTWVDTGVVLGDGWKIIHADFIDIYNANLGAMNVTPYSSFTGNPVGVMNLRDATISLKYMILQYTKTTD